MNKLPKIKLLLPEASRRSPTKKAESVDRAYEQLIATLNSLGYYPRTRADAKRIAKELLDQGWEEE